MYLRDIAVCSTWNLETADDYRSYFDFSTHIVVESVLAWIPRNTVKLDELAKLNVAVGDRIGLERRYDKWQGVGTYYVPEFDFVKYKASGEQTQQDQVIELLGSAFRHVSSQSGNDPSACLEVLVKIRSFGLPLPKFDTPAFWRHMPAQKKRSKAFKENIAFLAKLREPK